MLDGVSLDQLRTFIAAADEGSFSAAGRRLKRAQSVVSQTLANLEGQIGVHLFDRRGRFPVLTGQGRALLTEARAAVGGVELFKSRAKTLTGGLEPELNVVVDIMFPVAALICGVSAFQEKFPSTVLRLHIGVWSGVVEPVLDGRCSLGIVGSYVLAPPPDGHVVVMSAAYRKDIPSGPAVRWFIDHLKQEDARRLNASTLRSAASIPAIPERRPMWSRPPIERQQSR
jgi:DNA-binding transcriptional LysR family regulator